MGVCDWLYWPCSLKIKKITNFDSTTKLHYIHFLNKMATRDPKNTEPARKRLLENQIKLNPLNTLRLMGRIDGTNWWDDWWTTNRRKKETTRLEASPRRRGQGRHKQRSNDVQTNIKSTTKPPELLMQSQIPAVRWSESEVKWITTVKWKLPTTKRTSDSNELSTKETRQRHNHIKNTIEEHKGTKKNEEERRRKKEQGPSSTILGVSSWCLVRGRVMTYGHEWNAGMIDHHQPWDLRKFLN
jgi:hypothetical protein